MIIVRLAGDVYFDMRAGHLKVAGQRVSLEPRLAGLLALLVQKNGETVSRDELIETVWDGDVSDHALTQAISRLRRILGERQIIQTEARIGYSLTLKPEIVEPDALGAVQADPRPGGPQLRWGFPVMSWRRWIVLGAGIVMACIIAMPFYFEALPSSIQGLFCGACIDP